MEIYKKLNKIQVELKAPKDRVNKFGGFSYRNCEDILNALKPLLDVEGCAVILNDDVVQIGDRFYIKATATLYDENGENISNTAYAREPLQKKGADESQITGASSSYARKYALAGLLAIDSAEDIDEKEPPKEEPKEEPKETDVPRASEVQIKILKQLAEKQGKELDVELVRTWSIKQASDMIMKLKGDTKE
jgi:hypothetical protein